MRVVCVFLLTVTASACKRSTDEEPSTQSKTGGPAAVAASHERASWKVSDLEQILGSKADGWSPKVIAAFTLGMTPEEAERMMGGAGKLGEFGISEVQVTGDPLIVRYDFYFSPEEDRQPRRLYMVRINFDPALNDDKEFYDALVKATTAKYGAVEPQEIEKKRLTWIGPASATAQLYKIPDDPRGYQLTIRPPRK